MGYCDIFFDVFLFFVNIFNSEFVDVFFFEFVYEMCINDIFMGFVVEKYIKDVDGDVMIESEIVLLVLVDVNIVLCIDLVDILWSCFDGLFINGSMYIIDNGVLFLEFEILVVDDKWYVEG